MRVRYVIGRPGLPKPPRVLKSGALSTAKEQDTMAETLIAAADEMGVAPDAELLEALRDRDRRSWAYALDIWSSEAKRAQTLDNVRQVSGLMASCKGPAPRNPWSCDRCDWRAICDADPSGHEARGNPQVGDRRAPTPVGIRYNPKTTYWLNRAKPGKVISPSEVYCWLKCPRLWWLEYSERLQITKEWRRYEARARGSIIHAACEFMLLHWQDLAPDYRRQSWLHDPESMMPKVNDLQRTSADFLEPTLERISDEAGSDYQPSLIAEAMPGYLRCAWDMSALAMQGIAEVVEVERRRLIKLPGVNRWATGIPDAILRDSNGAEVVLELKTSASSNLQRAAEQYRTNPAVDLYAAMLQQGRPAQVKKGD